jgi:thiazole synthase
MKAPQMEDQLTLYGQSFSSRLLLGTARYDSPSLLADAISAADPAMLTVSVRRQIFGSQEPGRAFWNLLRDNQRAILPNTAGCLSARDAVRIACLACIAHRALKRNQLCRWCRLCTFFRPGHHCSIMLRPNQLHA